MKSSYHHVKISCYKINWKNVYICMVLEVAIIQKEQLYAPISAQAGTLNLDRWVSDSPNYRNLPYFQLFNVELRNVLKDDWFRLPLVPSVREGCARSVPLPFLKLLTPTQPQTYKEKTQEDFELPWQFSSFDTIQSGVISCNCCSLGSHVHPSLTPLFPDPTTWTEDVGPAKERGGQ